MLSDSPTAATFHFCLRFHRLGTRLLFSVFEAKPIIWADYDASCIMVLTAGDDDLTSHLYLYCVGIPLAWCRRILKFCEHTLGGWHQWSLEAGAKLQSRILRLVENSEALVEFELVLHRKSGVYRS